MASCTSDAARAAAMDALAADLRLATKHFTEGQNLQGGRLGCMLALKAVIDLCDAAELRAERTPLMKLFLALQSADAGVEDPLLSTVRRRGAPPLTAAELRQRGCCAAAMEALIRGGETPNHAAHYVARRARVLPAAQGLKTEVWKSVKKWREHAMSGDPKKDYDTVAFRAACDAFALGGAVGKRGADEMLKFAEAQCKIQDNPGSG